MRILCFSSTHTRLYDTAAHTSSTWGINSDKLKPNGFGNFARVLVSRNRDALQDTIADDYQRCTARSESIVDPPGKFIAIIEVGSSIVSPPITSIYPFLWTQLPERLQPFNEVCLGQGKVEIQAFLITHSLPILAEISLLQVFQILWLFRKTEPVELRTRIPNIMIIVQIGGEVTIRSTDSGVRRVSCWKKE